MPRQWETNQQVVVRWIEGRAAFNRTSSLVSNGFTLRSYGHIIGFTDESDFKHIFAPTYTQELHLISDGESATVTHIALVMQYRHYLNRLYGAGHDILMSGSLQVTADGRLRLMPNRPFIEAPIVSSSVFASGTARVKER